ncbi:MAG TPA: hypothetical protein VFU10_09055 [Gaiellaceae bacterium]|nr:hypothetical protein [Gaiellaceae bacterium]
MRNPFRSESEAFSFLLLVIVGAALIVVAGLLGGWWVGLPVAIVVIVGVIAVYRRSEMPPPRPVEPAPHGENERRILVIANETVGGDTLIREIRRRSEGAATQVLVVAPALNSHVRHWTSDEDGARAAAAGRLDKSVRELRAAGVDVEGRVGDSDPLQAIEDALRTFGADEILISTHPEGRSNWLERGVVEAATERFTPPVSHVITRVPEAAPAR